MPLRHENRHKVASRAEAWIETEKGFPALAGQQVASRAEAWIETETLGEGVLSYEVASRAEAWIETWNRSCRNRPA
mgnify:CR=1 FL=1